MNAEPELEVPAEMDVTASRGGERYCCLWCQTRIWKGSPRKLTPEHKVFCLQRKPAKVSDYIHRSPCKKEMIKLYLESNSSSNVSVMHGVSI
jgi:hypothetical protein